MNAEYVKNIRIIIAGLFTHFTLLLILLNADLDRPIQEEIPQ